MNTEPNIGYCVKHGAYRLDIGCLECARQNTSQLTHNHNNTNRGGATRLQWKNKRFKIKR